MVDTPFIVFDENVMMSASIDALAKALSCAQAELMPAEKNKINPHFGSAYADFCSLAETAKKVLPKYGLSYTQPVSAKAPFVSVRTILMHVSGQWISGKFELKSQSDTPQHMCSAVTYAKRYGLSSTLGMSADEDDDGNAASATTTTKTATTEVGQDHAQSLNPAEFVIPFGHNKGMRLKDLSPRDIASSINYWRDRSAKDKKPLTGKPLEFVQACETYLLELEKNASMEDEPPIPF